MILIILSHRRDVSEPETSWQCRFRPFSGWLASVCDSRSRVGLILDGETLCNIQFICHCNIVSSGAMSAPQTMSGVVAQRFGSHRDNQKPTSAKLELSVRWILTSHLYTSCSSGTVSTSNDSMAGISPPATILLVLIKVLLHNLAFKQNFLKITVNPNL